MTRIEKDKWYICHTQFGLADVGFKVKYTDYINKNGLRFVDENGMYYSIKFDEIEKYFKPIEVKENNMTKEEKAKRYDEALERARLINNGERVEVENGTSICEAIFPELKENEEEKIRKALIDGFTVMKESKNCGKTFSNHNIPVVDILAWLEKQGEQKPVTHKYNVGATIYYNSFGEIKSMVVANVVDIGDGNPMYEDADGGAVFEKNLAEPKLVNFNGEDYGIDGLWHAINILEKTLGKVEGYQSDDGILEHKCAITAVRDLAKKKNDKD